MKNLKLTLFLSLLIILSVKAVYFQNLTDQDIVIQVKNLYGKVEIIPPTIIEKDAISGNFPILEKSAEYPYKIRLWLAKDYKCPVIEHREHIHLLNWQPSKEFITDELDYVSRKIAKPGILEIDYSNGKFYINYRTSQSV
ncbi:hypothetical protein M1446_00055 [Candidatus Dependentiae bacterium]|nr:hypothetical protein [Candidatus Dependentiae bacterium]